MFSKPHVIVALYKTIDPMYALVTIYGSIRSGSGGIGPS